MFSVCQCITQTSCCIYFAFLCPVGAEVSGFMTPICLTMQLRFNESTDLPTFNTVVPGLGPRSIQPLCGAFQSMSPDACAPNYHCLSHPTWVSCSTGFPYRAAGLRESSTCRSLLFLLWTFCLQHLTKPSVAWTEGSSHTSSVACLCLEAGSPKDHQVEKQLPFFHR